VKRKWVLLVVAGLLSLWLASGLAYAQETKGKTVVQTVGNVQVEFVAPESGLVSGDNQIAVQLKDTTTGKPVVQNSLRVEMSMDTGDRSMNHGDMSTQKPVLAELQASKDVAGRYTGKVNLNGAGKWNAKVYLDAQRSTILGVSVAESGPNLFLIVGGAAAVIALGIAGVFVLKRKGAAPSVAGKAIEPA
jgi:hypothetical protein